MRDYIISFPMFGDGFTINPPASFSIAGFPIYLYGIIIGIGFLLAFSYTLKHCRQFGLKQDNIIDMLIIAVPSAIIMARLYYCAFDWEYYISNPLEIINIRSGGLAIYGSIIGAIIAVSIFSKVKKIPAGALLDACSLGLLIGQAVGRFGNFTNREAFGSVTDVFCRMGLTNPVNGDTIYVHPTFLYESLWNTFGFCLLHFFSKNVKRKYDWQLFIMYFGWYGLGRVFIEGLRSDSLYLWNTDIRVSQMVALISFITAVVLLVVNHRRFKNGAVLWSENHKNPLSSFSLADIPVDSKETGN